MSEPTQTCEICGRQVAVTPDGRGFPPEIARRKLARLCQAAGHISDPKYRAGLSLGGRVRGMTDD